MKAKYIDIKRYIKNIVLKTKKLNSTFLKKHPNSKYLLDDIINEILYFLKSGSSYRMFRSKINYKTLNYYYLKFIKYNIFHKLFNKIRTIYLKKNKSNNNERILYIDSTVVANKYGINKIGRNKFYKNKKSTKISLMTEKNGFPLSVFFIKGNYHDNRTFEKHIKDASVFLPNNKFKIIADKAYSSNKNYTLLNSINIKHIIPPRKNMKIYETYIYDKYEYKKRIKIEHEKTKFLILLLEYKKDLFIDLFFIYSED